MLAYLMRPVREQRWTARKLRHLEVVVLMIVVGKMLAQLMRPVREQRRAASKLRHLEDVVLMIAVGLLMTRNPCLLHFVIEAEIAEMAAAEHVV